MLEEVLLHWLFSGQQDNRGRKRKNWANQRSFLNAELLHLFYEA